MEFSKCSDLMYLIIDLSQIRYIHFPENISGEEWTCGRCEIVSREHNVRMDIVPDIIQYFYEEVCDSCHKSFQFFWFIADGTQSIYPPQHIDRNQENAICIEHGNIHLIRITCFPKSLCHAFPVHLRYNRKLYRFTPVTDLFHSFPVCPRHFSGIIYFPFHITEISSSFRIPFMPKIRHKDIAVFRENRNPLRFSSFCCY